MGFVCVFRADIFCGEGGELKKFMGELRGFINFINFYKFGKFGKFIYITGASLASLVSNFTC